MLLCVIKCECDKKTLFFYAFKLKICDYSPATLCSNPASIHINLISLFLVLNKI